jgi:hypothetical protein
MTHREPSRNRFGALSTVPQWVAAILKELDGKAWETGIEADRKGRGSSINVDVYSYDETRQLAVVQVRLCTFRPGRFNHVRKDYYLIGKNENGNAFAHPVESVARSKKAMATVDGGVTLALTRIWNCDAEDLDEIRRNGDIAFIPVFCLPDSAVRVEENGLTLRDSHVVEADELYKDVDGTYYVRGRARIKHLKRQHKQTNAPRGFWRVQPGLRASNWGFTAPTAD